MGKKRQQEFTRAIMALGIYKKKNLAKKALDRYCNRHNYLQALSLEVSPPRKQTLILLYL